MADKQSARQRGVKLQGGRGEILVNCMSYLYVNTVLLLHNDQCKNYHSTVIETRPSSRLLILCPGFTGIVADREGYSKIGRMYGQLEKIRLAFHI